MKQTKRIITLLLALTMVLSMSSTVFAAAPSFTGRMDDADTESAETPAHNYANGFCTDCGAYEPAPQVTAENQAELGLSEHYIGYYAIGNAGQLYWFADKVDQENYNYMTANVILTNNITVNQGTVTASSTGLREWNPIGSMNNEFGGIFDGNGKTVSGLYISGEFNAALIAATDTTALIKNVTLSNSYLSMGDASGGIVGENEGTVSGCVNNATIMSENTQIGGIVGSNYGTITGCANNGSVTGNGWDGGIVGYNAGTVELCGNTGTVSGTDMMDGGIVGRNCSIVRNCWNTGELHSEGFVGGIVGLTEYKDKGSPLVENCWSTGSIFCDGSDYVGGIAGKVSDDATVRNCYSILEPVRAQAENSIVTNVEAKTSAQFASGEVTYLLGGVWGQNIDNGQPVQSVPVFSNATVYQVGTDKYSNSNNPQTHEHSYDNGFCTVCDDYEPAPLVTNDNYSKLGLSAGDVGSYAISNAGQLYWFAQRAEEYSKDSAVLAKNITVNTGTVNASSSGLREWTPIAGCGNYFYGTFDGNGKTIFGLYYKNTADDANAYYVGLVSMLGETGVVKNVTISNSYLEGMWHIGAIAGHNDGLISGCGNNATIKGKRNAGGITGVNFGTIELCGNAGNVAVTDQMAGGIAGIQEGTVRNCWNTGNIKTDYHGAGGIAGYSGASAARKAASVENCWSTGTVTCDGDNTGGGLIGKTLGNLTVRNCYTTMDKPIGKIETYDADSKLHVDKVETKTRDQFTSGEVAYLLGGVWGQNIDNGETVQTVPVFSTATIYQVEIDNKGSVGYSNSPDANNTDSAPEDKNEDKAWQQTCQLPVAAYIMVEDEPVFLAGAGFTLYKDEACTQPITVSDNGTHEGNPLYLADPAGTVTEIFTDDSGRFLIAGLESGTYYLKQTTTPPGYHSDDAGEDIIPVTFSIKGDLSCSSIDEDSPLTDETGKLPFIPIRNHADTTQSTPDDAGNPDGTGSAGIYILIGILGLLAVAAVVLLVIKRRISAAG